jgi:hypothetical protein
MEEKFPFAFNRVAKPSLLSKKDFENLIKEYYEQAWEDTFRFISECSLINEVDKANAAYFRSSRFKGSGSWLTFGHEPTNAFSFLEALRCRLLIHPLYHADQHILDFDRLQCNCQSPDSLAENPHHLYYCASNGRNVYIVGRHNAVRDLFFAEFRKDARAQDIVVTKEYNIAPRCRTDIFIQGQGFAFSVDFVITDPTQTQGIASAMSTSGYHANRVEDAKVAHYARNAPDVNPHVVHPFGIEATGLLGDRANAFLEECKTRFQWSEARISTVRNKITAICVGYTGINARIARNGLVTRRG